MKKLLRYDGVKEKYEGRWLIDHFLHRKGGETPRVIASRCAGGMIESVLADHDLQSPSGPVRPAVGESAVQERRRAVIVVPGKESFEADLQSAVQTLDPGGVVLALVPGTDGERASVLLRCAAPTVLGAAAIIRPHGLCADNEPLLGAVVGRSEHAATAAELSMADLGLEDIDRVIDLADRVMFLPKTSWRTTHVSMMREGLARGVWHGSGIIDPETGAIVSYLDYRLMPDGRARLGFCMSDPGHRGRGHMQRLVSHFVLRHFERLIDVSSHERNRSMLGILARHGFLETRRVDGERINGEASLYLERAAYQPIIPLQG